MRGRRRKRCDSLEYISVQAASIPSRPLAHPRNQVQPVALAQVQPSPVVPVAVGDREGVRSTFVRAKGKLNSTVTSTRDKVKAKIGTKIKDKIKDKVKEKATKKLDPTGGHIKS